MLFFREKVHDYGEGTCGPLESIHIFDDLSPGFFGAVQHVAKLHQFSNEGGLPIVQTITRHAHLHYY